MYFITPQNPSPNDTYSHADILKSTQSTRGGVPQRAILGISCVTPLNAISMGFIEGGVPHRTSENFSCVTPLNAISMGFVGGVYQ